MQENPYKAPNSVDERTEPTFRRVAGRFFFAFGVISILYGLSAVGAGILNLMGWYPKAIVPWFAPFLGALMWAAFAAAFMWLSRRMRR